MSFTLKCVRDDNCKAQPLFAGMALTRAAYRVLLQLQSSGRGILRTLLASSSSTSSMTQSQYTGTLQRTGNAEASRASKVRTGREIPKCQGAKRPFLLRPINLDQCLLTLLCFLMAPGWPILNSHETQKLTPISYQYQPRIFNTWEAEKRERYMGSTPTEC